MILKVILFIFFICQFNSCAQNLGSKEEAKKLNDTAMQLAFGSTDSIKIKNSIGMLDKAISIDSSYFMAYSNKISLLFQLDNDLEVLKTLNNLSKIVGENSFIFFTRGLAYKKIGKNELSYSNLMAAFELSSKLKDSLDKTMYCQLLVYFESKKTALNKLNELLNVGTIKKEEFSNLSDLIQSIDESDPLGIEN